MCSILEVSALAVAILAAFQDGLELTEARALRIAVGMGTDLTSAHYYIFSMMVAEGLISPVAPGSKLYSL